MSWTGMTAGRWIRGAAAAALFAALAMLTPPALGAKTGSPACRLLDPPEVIRALSGAFTLDDSGPGKAGYSDCAWRNGDHGTLATLILWSPEHFETGGPDAGALFGTETASQRGRGHRVVTLPALGEMAAIADEGSADLEGYTVIVAKGGAVIELTTRGIARSAAIDLAKAAVAHLADAAVMADIPVPRANPFAPEKAASESPAAPEAAPAAPELAPLPVAPPDPGASAPQPKPSVPPSPSPPAPEIPTPPVAPAPDVSVSPPPTPVEPPSTPPSDQPRPSAPEPEPPAAGPGLAAPAETASACRVLTPRDFTIIHGAVSRTDSGVRSPGESTCEWQASGGAIALSVTLLEGDAITGTAPNAAAYFAGLEQPSQRNGIEVLDGIGQQATLQVTGDGDTAFLAFAIRSNEKILFLTISGISRDAAISLAEAASRRM